MSRQFSSTALRQGAKLVNRRLDNWISQLPRPLTVKQLGQALELKDNQISTRLTFRTAKAMTRELERRFLELQKRCEAVVPATLSRLETRRQRREALQRTIEYLAWKKPGKSGIYLQPRVKRLVSSYIKIKMALVALAKEFDAIIAGNRKSKRHTKRVETRPATKKAAKKRPLVRKITLNDTPLGAAMETKYQLHTTQITNLTVSAREITYAIRNRVPNSSFRLVASTGPSTSVIKNRRDSHLETARAQLRRWSAEHIRFYNDIIFIKYLVRRRKQVLHGHSTVPVNKYYAKSDSVKPRKPRIRNNTVGIRRVRVRRYTTKGTRFHASKQRDTPVLRIRRYRGNPRRDSPQQARISEDDKTASRADRLRKKREFTSTVGAWLGGGSGIQKGASTATPTVQKQKRVFGASIQNQEKAADAEEDVQSATSGDAKFIMNGHALLMQTAERMEEKDLKQGGGRRR